MWQQNRLIILCLSSVSRQNPPEKNIRFNQDGWAAGGDRAEACFSLRLCSGWSSQGWEAAGGYRMWLCRGFSAQEAVLNFICAPLSPLNYSSGDGAPETTALGDTGCSQRNRTANILQFQLSVRRIHPMRKRRFHHGEQVLDTSQCSYLSQMESRWLAGDIVQTVSCAAVHVHSWGQNPDSGQRC